MDGRQWLSEVFRPALDGDSVTDGGADDILRGQLRALHDCGVLADAEHTAAEQHLDEAVAAAHRNRLRLGPPASIPPGPPPRSPLGSPRSLPGPSHGSPPAVEFRCVVPVGRPLITVDDMPLLLTAVEVWSHRVHVHLAAVLTAAAIERIREHDAAMRAWSDARMARTSAGALPPPAIRGSRLNDVTITINDDTGTTYRWEGGSAGGTGTEWRAQQHYAPGVPAKATRLTITAAETGDSLTIDL